MADQFTNQQGQAASTFTKQEEEAAVAFGLQPSEAGLEYQATPALGTPKFSLNLLGSGPITFDPDTYGKHKVVDAFVDLTNMGPDQITSLQHKLYDAGLYDAGYYKPKGPNIHFGDLDQATVDAYKTLISQSVRSGGKKTPDDILSQGAEQGYGKGLEQQVAPKPPPLTIQLTNPDDLLATADSVARKLIGRKLTDGELRNFVDSFHTMEANAQQAKYQQSYSQGYDETTGSFRGPGGTLVKPPDAESEAIMQLRREHPEDVRNVEMEHGYDVFNSLIGGPGGR